MIIIIIDLRLDLHPMMMMMLSLSCLFLVLMLQMTADQLLEMYKGFVAKYPVVTIEDAYDQDAWDAWAKMNATMTNIQLVG